MTTYYIDKTLGDDTNNGTSELIPWETVSKVNATVISGDIVLFKGGEIWREQLVGVVGVTYGKYGTGTPKIHNTIVANGPFNTLAGYGTGVGQNGGFETGENGRWAPAGWVPDNSANIISTPISNVYEGTYSVRLRKDGSGTNISMSFPFNAYQLGASFKLRFHGKSDGDGVIKYQVINTIDEDTTYLQANGTDWHVDVHTFEGITAVNTEFAEVTRTFILPSAGTIMTACSVNFINDALNSDAWLDNFQLEPIWIETGTENVWMACLDNKDNIKASLVFDGLRCTFVDTLIEVAAARDVFLDTGENAYYTYSETDPATLFGNGTFWEWFKYDDVANVDIPAFSAISQDGIVLDSIDFRGGGNLGPSFVGDCLHIDSCNGITIKNCIVSGSDGVGIQTFDCDNVDIQVNTIQECGLGGIWVYPSGSEYNISYNVITRIADRVSDAEADGHHIVVSGLQDDGLRPVTNVTVNHNIMTNSGSTTRKFACVVLFNIGNAIVSGNDIHGNRQSGIVAANNCDNVTISYNLIYDNVGNGWIFRGIGVTQTTGQDQMHPGDGTISNIYILNNTIVGNDDADPGTNCSGIFISNSGVGKDIVNCVVKNNISAYNFESSGVLGSNLRVNGAGMLDVTLDYNLYWAVINSDNLINHTNDTYSLAQFATYQSEKSQDANSIAENPLVVDLGGNDYHLTSNSPAKETGVELGIATDFDGKPYSHPPSMGAYEYLSFWSWFSELWW